MNVAISDWVKGRTEAGAFIYGYVETIDQQHGVAQVQVLGSDHEEVAGTVITLPKSLLRRLPVNSFDAAEPIKHLIDIALSIRDEAWFTELTDKLISIQQRDSEQSKDQAFQHKLPTNRLGLRGMK